MPNNKICTLIDLLSEYDVIEIPKVQRDYVQGREDKHAKHVRNNLLSDIKLAITSGSPIDLNFVYGKSEDKKFIPIDGQQRLTTLFLLHLYAFASDGSKTDLLKKFTYETRESSRDFLEKLVRHRSEIFQSKPSDEITDASWFQSGWEYDPTIQSVLVMLDGIYKICGDVDNLSEILQEDSPLVFNFLDMNDLGMEDSLYIKLNARGKALTDFENFKAQLTGRLKVLKVPFEVEFESNLDGNWTELFWNSDSPEKCDETILLFWDTLLKNEGLLENTNRGIQDFLTISQLDFSKIKVELFETAFGTLNFLYDHKESEAYKIVSTTLTDLSRDNTATHTNSVLFHAVTTYFKKTQSVLDTNKLDKWLRIFRNLIFNTAIDKPQLRRSAIASINLLANDKDSILELFAEKSKIPFFNKEQVFEEQIKAKLILGGGKIVNEIFLAEANTYFGGQIRCILELSGYYKDDGDIEKFKEYREKINLLFDIDKPRCGILIRQSLLTFIDYRMDAGRSYVYKALIRSLCVDTSSILSKSPTMKRLFTEHSDKIKILLDKLNSNSDFDKQLKNIVDNHSVSENDWRYCFIKYPKIFNFMSASHMRMLETKDEKLLIPNSDSSQNNTNIFLAALSEELKSRGIESNFDGKWRQDIGRFLKVRELKIEHKTNKFIVSDMSGTVIFDSKTNVPITEISDWICHKM